METIKEKIIVIIGIVLVIALCCGAYYMLVYQSSDYYTQIDNTKVEKISKHNMNYEYTLYVLLFFSFVVNVVKYPSLLLIFS